MKCQGKRWSLSRMRSWSCGPIQYPLLMTYSLLFGTRLELCLWVILIETAQCCGAGDWSRAWIPVVLGSGWQGPCPEFPVWGVLHDLSHPEHVILWVFGSSKAALLLHIHSKDIAGSPEESGRLGPSTSPISLFPIPSFPLTPPSFPIKKERTAKTQLKWFFFFLPEPLVHKCSL